ncbi:arsenate reductase [Salmonella enterica subsp. enterica]|nr:arsenate reductase [Salmonella enterica subsp. enterica]
MSVTLYGFKSCDMVRNAMKWLEAEKVDYTLFDYRRQKLDPKTVDDWFKRAGWETVFNRNSTSYKEMPEAEKAAVDEKKAKDLILANTNLIKRPVLDAGDKLVFGFKPATFAEALGK